ncbi:hypothetical protein [Mycolicibacterium sp.]|uniref:hypothetical protein n=1 Tax=Mycolicibacterium sp. TaxID=2320850 RepID=UPI0037C822C0
MPDTHPSSDDQQPVRVTGVPTDIADHPAVRKVARAVLSIAARQLAEQQAAPASEDSDE